MSGRQNMAPEHRHDWWESAVNLPPADVGFWRYACACGARMNDAGRVVLPVGAKSDLAPSRGQSRR